MTFTRTYTRTLTIGEVYRDVHDELVEYGRGSPIEEVGGVVILAPRRYGLRVVHWYAIDNVAPEHQRTYSYKPNYAQLLDCLPASGEVWGSFHTHPTADEQPSRQDTISWTSNLACNLIFSNVTDRLALYGPDWEPMELAIYDG